MNAWKNQNALLRVFNVFKRNKKGVYPEDIQALQRISALIENEVAKVAVDNILFTKLLCCMLRYHFWHYGDIKLAIKKVSSDLSHSMGAQVTFLAKALKDKDAMDFFENLEGKNLNDHQAQILQKLDNNWNEDKVRKSLYNTANDLIQDINNYK